MTGFEAFVAAQYPGAEVTALSDTNNAVYLVSGPAGTVVAKHVTDTDIPVRYLARASAALAEHVPVARVLRVCDRADGDPYDAVFTEHVPGQDLARVLAEQPGRLDPQDVGRALAELVLACRSLPELAPGFTLYRTRAVSHASHGDFLTYYAQRYWGRVRAEYDGTALQARLDHWAGQGLAEVAAEEPADSHVVPIDANLRNFLVTPQGQVVVLNVPIVGRSSAAHAVGAVALHLRHRPERTQFLAAVVRLGLCPNPRLVPHLELLGLLGVMSFYAVRQPGLVERWRNWGSPVTLDEDLRALVDAVTAVVSR